MVRHSIYLLFILAHSVAAQAAIFAFNYEFLITNFECEALVFEGVVQQLHIFVVHEDEARFALPPLIDRISIG